MPFKTPGSYLIFTTPMSFSREWPAIGTYKQSTFYKVQSQRSIGWGRLGTQSEENIELGLLVFSQTDQEDISYRKLRLRSHHTTAYSGQLKVKIYSELFSGFHVIKFHEIRQPDMEFA